MKHAVAGRKLNRSKKHRTALFANLMMALFSHGSITTTQAKAKAIKGQAEKLITLAKQSDVSARRSLAQVFGKRSIANLLVDRLAKQQTRDSGYSRIVILGERRGDNALMVRLELVDYQAPEDVKPTVKKEIKKVAKKPIKPAKPTKPVPKFASPGKIAPQKARLDSALSGKSDTKSTKKV